MNEKLTEKQQSKTSVHSTSASVSSRTSSGLKSCSLVSKNYSYKRDYLKTGVCFKSTNKHVKIIQVSKSGNNYILKRMRKISTSANEIKLHWLSADCEKIVNIFDLYEDKEFYYLIIEFMPGGDLSTILQNEMKFSEHDAAVIMYQICLAVEHLHSLKIAHSNLVPECVLFSEWKTDRKSMELNLKLSDFSLAEKLNDDVEIKKAFSYDIRCLGKIMSLLCPYSHASREAKNLMDNMHNCKSNSEINIQSVIESVWIKRHVRSTSYLSPSTSVESVRKNSQLSLATNFGTFTSEINGCMDEYEDTLNKSTSKANQHTATMNGKMQSTIERDLEKISIRRHTASQQEFKNGSLAVSLKSIDRLDEDSLNLPKVIQNILPSISAQLTASRCNLNRTTTENHDHDDDI